ncbi:hypothetical protein ALC60_06900, partial [Trachymyrmex zeteki]
IAQLVLLYCVVAQSYVPENRSLTEDATSFQDLCDDIVERNGTQRLKLMNNLYSFFWLSYTWSRSIPHHSNTRGRRFLNEHPLKDQSSVPVEKRDSRIEDQRITADEIINHVKSIVMESKRLQDVAKNAVINSSQNLSQHTEMTLLWFVIKIYQWTSDVMVLNTIGNSFAEKILKLPERCILLPMTNYTLQDRIVSSSDIINIIKMIEDQLHEESEELYEKKKLWRMTGALVKNIKSIVFELNEKLHSQKNGISFGLNNRLCDLQLLAYKWVLNIRYPNIRKKSIKKSRPPLEDRSSFSMEKNDNGPTDQDTADVVEDKSSTTKGNDTKRVCKFKRNIRLTLEMQLFIFSRIALGSFFYEYDSNTTRKTRSVNDFQLSLDDQSFSLPMEESELEDEEITIKDFMDNLKLTKRQLNENLKIFEKTTMDADNDFFQKLWNVKNHKHVKRSNFFNRYRTNFIRLKYILTIYRWISNMIIYNLLSKTSLSNIYPHLQKCQHTFPMKNQLDDEFDRMSDDIIFLTNLLPIINN